MDPIKKMSSPPFASSSSSALGRAQMRRVSLPSALPGGQRVSRSPNSLSPKLGFLKEISEFDIDPPFISPAASSSSSADNSPMLLSPSFQRPSSARLYRRNPQPQRGSQPSSPGTRKAILNRQNAGDSTTVATANAATEPEDEEEEEEEEEDGFRWTDVDGFYGRKNSIPLQQLLANDLALLNGANLLSDYDEKKPVEGDSQFLGPNQNGTGGAGTEHQNQQNGGGGGVNIPSDITEDEEEEEEEGEDGENNNNDKQNQKVAEQHNNNHQHKKMNARRSLGAVSEKLFNSNIKRKMFLASKMHSLEGTKQEEQEEEGEEETESTAKAPPTRGKIKFEGENSVDKLTFIDANDGNVSEEVKELRNALREKRKMARAAQRVVAQQLRHFSIDAYGQRIVDSGVRTIPATQTKNSKAAPQSRNANARRATCPEIWLSVAEDAQLPKVHCALRLYGLINCGKKSVAKQLASSLEAVTPNDDGLSIESDDLQRPFRTVSFLLNDQEVHMELIQGSLMPESRKGVTPGPELTIFAVVYSVDNRESFIRAAQILYRLYGEREANKSGKGRKKLDKSSVPLILIANKIDLQRKRRVTSIEGKMLAKIYKCPFVELSALLSANVDTLWREVLRKLHKYLQARERMLQQRESSGDSTSSSPRLRMAAPRQHALVGRILERTRRFAKSCGHLIRDQFPS